MDVHSLIGCLIDLHHSQQCLQAQVQTKLVAFLCDAANHIFTTTAGNSCIAVSIHLCTHLFVYLLACGFIQHTSFPYAQVHTVLGISLQGVLIWQSAHQQTCV